jgi:hypothetical protein
MTIVDYIMLAGLISFCGFISYTAHEVGNAIWDMLD